jgi:hypothetical protein
LKELRALTVGAGRKASEDNDQVKLTMRIKELEEAVALKDVEIQRLREQIDLLSKLSVSLEGFSSPIPMISDTHMLNVDQAVVGRVIAGEQSVEMEAEATRSAASHVSELRTMQHEVSLTPAERRKLDSIIQRLRKLPRLQRLILRLLIEHEGTAMTVPMMASWLSLKESTIRSRPPYDLMRMKLVTRVRGRKGYKYVSSISAYLRSEFPQVDPDLLLGQIF